ncbi:MAG: hypothetical protein KBB95_19835, partial [Deltaproteobacteria bacterium]|nr:hypothetical protein [Deltaproteobacteria bacterium]
MDKASRASRLWLLLLLLAAAQPAACTDFDGFSVGTEDMGVDSDVQPDLGHDDAAMDAEVDADTGTHDAGGDPDMGNDDQGTPNDQGMVDADSGCVSDAECPGEYRCDPDTDTCHASCAVATELIACKPSGHCS